MQFVVTEAACRLTKHRHLSLCVRTIARVQHAETRANVRICSHTFLQKCVVCMILAVSVCVVLVVCVCACLRPGFAVSLSPRVGVLRASVSVFARS